MKKRKDYSILYFILIIAIILIISGIVFFIQKKQVNEDDEFNEKVDEITDSIYLKNNSDSEIEVPSRENKIVVTRPSINETKSSTSTCLSCAGDSSGSSPSSNPSLDYPSRRINHTLNESQITILCESDKIPGDTDLDKDVDTDDFNSLSEGWFGPDGDGYTPGSIARTRASWSTGDFDGDKDIDYKDFFTLSENWGVDCNEN